MARGDNFHCSVVTPEAAVIETEAHFVAFPAHDGEVGVLHDRAPLLFQLGSGLLRIETGDGEHRLFVSGGFAQMVDNRLTILTEEATEPGSIDKEQARAELARAKEMSGRDEMSAANRQRALDRARGLLRAAG
jgi:F-type H+-transporting ATPase subunit epsilon